MATDIVVFLTSRGNYARVGTILHALDEDPEFDLKIVVAGSAVLRKYGTLPEMLESDGLTVDETFHNVIEGGTPASSSKTTGLSIIEFTHVLEQSDPDGVITIADRYESMSVTVSASYLNIPVIHVQGGEFSGSIDDKVRHATTKLSDYHFVATEQSKAVVEQLGEPADRVFATGCPSVDLAADIEENADDTYDPQEEYSGVGADVDVEDDYIVVQYHPVSTQYQSQYDKTWELIDAVDELDTQAFWFWPNMDAGTDKVSKAIREYRDHEDPDDIRFYINMRPRDYLTLVSNADCHVGNSSVAIRECSYLGQPAVNIGDRQKYRERAANVTDVPCESAEIRDAIRDQQTHGSYACSTLYGEGDAGERIAERLDRVDLERKDAMHPELLGFSPMAGLADDD
jgi:UDP-hydrolysing UDP-N-acetyl-D-glucosamine 2-epimerase